ncbi:MAG: type VI secretion system baseplate subunit TssG [Nannocystaceae bacterium]
MTHVRRTSSSRGAAERPSPSAPAPVVDSKAGDAGDTGDTGDRVPPAWLDAHRRDPSRGSLLALLTALRRRAPAAALALQRPAALRYWPRSRVAPRAVDPAAHGHDLALEVADPRRAALVGASTPLPLAMIEAAASTSRRSDLRDFFDLFHAQLLTLEVDALGHLQPPQRSGDASRWEARLLAAAGLDPSTSCLPRDRRLALLPLLLGARAADPRLLARALEIAVEDIAPTIEVRVEPFAADLAPQPEAAQRRLGDPAARLGSLALGDTVRVAHGLRIALRGVPRAALRRFIPNADGRRRVLEILEKLAPPGIRWTLELIPASPRDAAARLGAACLGATWIGATAGPARRRAVNAPPRPRARLDGAPTSSSPG